MSSSRPTPCMAAEMDDRSAARPMDTRTTSPAPKSNRSFTRGRHENDDQS